MDILSTYNEELAEYIEFHARYEEDMPVYVKELLLQRIAFLKELTEDLKEANL